MSGGDRNAASLSRAFNAHVRDTVVAQIGTRLDTYVEALAMAVGTMRRIAEEDLDPQPGAGAAATAAPAPPTAPNGTKEDVAQARAKAQRRYRYANRFHAEFGLELMADASEARDAFFAELSNALRPPPDQDEIARLPNETNAPAAPDLVRPGVGGRIMAVVRRRPEREVPVARLGALYQTELMRRLGPVADGAARLASVAIAEIRWQLQEHTALEHDEAGSPPSLAAAAADVAARLEAVAAEIADEYDLAVRATVIRVADPAADAGDRATARYAATLATWSEFETTLTANVTSEAVLARALAAMEATVAKSAGELESIRLHRGADPLKRLADGVAALDERAAESLGEDSTGTLESLVTEAGRLFDAELPRVRALLPRVVEQVERLKNELAAIPEGVPEDLQISEHPVPDIPEQPRGVRLREAPLEELLNTACGGLLPRWLDRAVAGVREELEAMVAELDRARNALEFQLKAPLRGGFQDAEIRQLVAGITERTAAQLEDLRAQGLALLDSLVTGLEEQARDEAVTLRSAVANREFMRIHSEIAEEQAVRQFETGLARARGGAMAAGRAVGRLWGGIRDLVAKFRAWTQRQLGVDEVEREEMLESLEQSLLGADQKVVALPAIYRQLFDVEGDVPWDELLVPRDEELDALRRAFDRWAEDLSATVAVVGEKGSGKTTLLRLAEHEVFADSRVVRASLGRSIDDPEELLHRLADAFGLDADTAPQTDAELADRINAQEPAVAIVEDLHHLFIRSLGGFDAIEAFLQLISQTRMSVLWVVTVDEFAWRYLSRVVGLDAHFVHKISTTNLSPDKLERAIMARHNVSGFALRFETESTAPHYTLWDRLLGRASKGELTRKETERRRFFRELASIAEGNIVLAFFYWLRSIREMDEHVLVFGDPEIIELEFLDRLPLAQLHSIAAIILHGGLSEAAHRKVFQLPAVESRLLLASLADSHMVFLSSDGEYKINKVLYRPFIRLLVAKNVF